MHQGGGSEDSQRLRVLFTCGEARVKPVTSNLLKSKINHQPSPNQSVHSTTSTNEVDPVIGGMIDDLNVILNGAYKQRVDNQVVAEGIT